MSAPRCTYISNIHTMLHTIYIYTYILYRSEADAVLSPSAFLDPVRACADSSIYMTRVMAARALVPLIPTNQVLYTVYI